MTHTTTRSIRLVAASAALFLFVGFAVQAQSNPGMGMGMGQGMGQGNGAGRGGQGMGRGMGGSLMTSEERTEHRNQMRSAKTYDECKAIQQAQHERMVERAKAQGQTLPVPRANACDRMKAKGFSG